MKATSSGNWFYEYFLAKGYEPPRVPTKSPPNMGIGGSTTPIAINSDHEGGLRNLEVGPP